MTDDEISDAIFANNIQNKNENKTRGVNEPEVGADTQGMFGFMYNKAKNVFYGE